MNFRDKPDPTIDWDNIHYNIISDTLRPEPGYRFCRKCKKLYAINNWNFSKDKRSPDSYSYQCKQCAKEYQKNKRKQQKPIIDDDF